MTARKKLFLGLLALVLVGIAPLRAQTYGPYFDDETFAGYDGSGYAVFYLPDFGYYTYLGFTSSFSDKPYPGYLYKYNFGFLYSFGNSGGNTLDVYLYDFGQRDNLGYIYTAVNYGSDARNYLYLYSFRFGNVVLYFQNTFNPRDFYDYGTRSYFSLF